MVFNLVISAYEYLNFHSSYLLPTCQADFIAFKSTLGQECDFFKDGHMKDLVTSSHTP